MFSTADDHPVEVASRKPCEVHVVQQALDQLIITHFHPQLRILRIMFSRT